MYSVLNTLSEYTYFYISKDITLYAFSLVFKIVQSLQCIPNTLFLQCFFMTHTFYLVLPNYEVDICLVYC